MHIVTKTDYQKAYWFIATSNINYKIHKLTLATMYTQMFSQDKNNIMTSIVAYTIWFALSPQFQSNNLWFKHSVSFGKMSIIK